jgi:ABC-type sugar transport system ATPase subunit
VTHDQVEAMTMGHRICIMNKGEVVQIGRPLEVYRDPANTFVARFLGNPPMNLLAARIESVGNRFEITLAGMQFRLPVPLEARDASRPVGEVTLGIRPEDLYEVAAPEIAARAVRLPVKVVAVQPLGAETLQVLALRGEGE